MKKIILAAALGALAATTAQGATLVNGSFESGPNPGSYTTLGTGDTSITGWTVESGTIDYIGSYWQAGQGSRSIDLAGNSVGTLSQIIADTIVGQTYKVSFLVSKNPDGGLPLRSGTVAFGGQVSAFAYSAPNSTSNMNWQQASYTFTATSTSTRLAFSGDGTAGCCFGPALDAVSIAAVPEPATWAMMIGGFGMIGGGLRSARRRTRTTLVTARTIEN